MQSTSTMASHAPQQSSLANPISRMAVRRSVTVPSKLQVDTSAQLPAEIGDSRGVETIFTHPSAKVVSFTAAPATSNRRVSEGDGAGTLSWRTPTERTVATGPLEIYRVPGSVSFLYSGALLHALLPRANCWCVDGNSTFILKVSINTYYRIELPGITEEDLTRVEEFKVTLQKVLFYERTPCPFRKGFSAELPDTPSPTSRRRSRYSIEPVKKWKLDGVWKPEDDEEWQPKYDRASVLSRAEGMIQRGESSPKVRRQRPFSMEDKEGTKVESDGEQEEETPQPKRPMSFSEMRSITAPPKLTLVASPPSKTSSRASSISDMQVDQTEEGQEEQESENESEEEHEPANSGDDKSDEDEDANEGEDKSEGEGEDETIRQDSNAESPQTVSAETTAEPEDTLFSKLQQAQKEALLDHHAPLSAVSQATDGGIMSEDDAVESRIWGGISTPSLSSDSEDHSWGEVITPPETLRIRKTRKMNAAESLSRASSASRLRRSSRESQNALTNGIVRKTCSLVLGPPAHLVSIMLKIAAKITNGAFSLTIKSPLDSPHTVPGSWYVGDEEDDWDLDDYGFPVGQAQKRVT
ncbi:inheritance of peroxisomes protein 1-domain-containing protein [Elsinoe ampelina]|uniref:Inheritance of peroxisomes protein 1 n=1 Tax=Elsinoe ampelina TaxID=302913 RepID=A0A6A6GQF5_9PEZI|nr:inheritance of peroxisomes protein 1-domain-containing protein [Elsinoe ampelina]